MSKKHPSSGEVVWTRRQLSPGLANQDVEQPLWHRAVSVNETAVQTACQRFFVKPVDLSTGVPDGESTCRLCQGRLAAEGQSAVPDAD